MSTPHTDNETMEDETQHTPTLTGTTHYFTDEDGTRYKRISDSEYGGHKWDPGWYVRTPGDDLWRFVDDEEASRLESHLHDEYDLVVTELVEALRKIANGWVHIGPHPERMSEAEMRTIAREALAKARPERVEGSCDG